MCCYGRSKHSCSSSVKLIEIIAVAQSLTSTFFLMKITGTHLLPPCGEHGSTWCFSPLEQHLAVYAFAPPWQSRRRNFLQKPRHESFFSPHTFANTTLCFLHLPFSCRISPSTPRPAPSVKGGTSDHSHQSQLPAGERSDPGLRLQASVTALAFQVYLHLPPPHLAQMPARKGISFLMPYPKLVKCAQIRELYL